MCLQGSRTLKDFRLINSMSGDTEASEKASAVNDELLINLTLIKKKKKRIERTIVSNIMLYLRNFVYVYIFVYLCRT